MIYWKTLLSIFFLGISFTLSGNSCLMKCQDFEELLTVIEKEYSFAIDSAKIARYRKWTQKPNYEKAADTLYSFAKDFFTKKLPDSLLCNQVGVSSNHSFAGLYGNYPSLKFTFNFDENPNVKKGNYVDFTFTLDLKTKKLSYYSTVPNIWLPDCKNYPDSCQFKVSNRPQAINILKNKGIINEDHYLYFHPNFHLPFHFNIAIPMKEECMMRDYSVNMYSGKITVSEIYKRFNCFTFEDLINYAEIVIQGEIRDIKHQRHPPESYPEYEKGVMFDRNIFSQIEIEVQKVFKGEINSPVIEAIKLGGTVGNMNSSLSHGAISAGHPGSPYIFFLSKTKGVNLTKNWAKLDSLSLFPLYYFTSHSIPIYDINNFKMHTTSVEKKLYQKIEKATGKNRIDIRTPATKDKEIINWLVENRKNVPDISSGLAFFMTAYAIMEDNYLPVYINVAGANRHSYLKNWTLRVSYNQNAFGKNLAEEKNLRYKVFRTNSEKESIKSYDFGIPNGYSVNPVQESDSTFLIHFRKTETAKEFFQILPAHNYKIPILELRLPIISDRENSNLKIEQVGNPIAIDLKSGKEEKYDYIFITPQIKSTPRSFRKAIISNFHPKIVSVGDTVTIEGSYLENAKVGIFGSSRGRSFYGSLPFGKTLEKTESKIRFILPEFLDMQSSAFTNSTNYRPISGEIYLSKEFRNSLTTSNEILEILKD